MPSRPDVSRYQSYLLCLWLADNGGQPVWRFSLESPGDRQRLVFDELEDVIEFVRRQMLPGEPSRGDAAGQHSQESQP